MKVPPVCDFQDGTNYTGLVEDFDLKSDLATLRIPVLGLPVMKLGSSSDIQPGEWVCTVIPGVADLFCSQDHCVQSVLHVPVISPADLDWKPDVNVRSNVGRMMLAWADEVESKKSQ